MTTKLRVGVFIPNSIRSLFKSRDATFKTSMRYSSIQDTKKTCLYDFHIENGGKMVDFCGYLLPIRYQGFGIIDSHNHTRSNCSLFDVSHMLQFQLKGSDRIKFIESLVVGDISSLGDNDGVLSVLTNDNGGILDDLIINKLEDSIYVVSNACCREKVLKLLFETLNCISGNDIIVDVLDDRGLVALQGPRMAEVLQPLTNVDLSQLYFMKTIHGSVCGIENCRITRCGYTGEDGVEISFPSQNGLEIVNQIAQNSIVKPAGLGTRDSLRIEAGLCLYGNDIDESTTPVEAGLTWTIGKKRRVACDFPGCDVIIKQIKEKPRRRRIGLISAGPPARNGTSILGKQDEVIGHVTSGCPSPTLLMNVAMGYANAQECTPGTPIKVAIRNKLYEGEIVKLPFIPSKYYTLK